MNKRNSIAWWALLIPVPILLWIGIKIAPYWGDGLPGLISNWQLFEEGLKSPFSFILTSYTVQVLLIFTGVYALGILVWLGSRGNYRRGEEHGSARWANLKVLLKKYGQDKTTDRILSNKLRIGLNTWKHRRTLNTLNSGGTGAGKTRFVLKPNLLQANTSYVVLDPAGELERDMAPFLLDQGYRVVTLNLKDFLASDHYNPFNYIETDNDVYTLVNNLVKATKDKEEKANDPFWDNASSALLAALIFLLREAGKPTDQNFGAVVELIEQMQIDENQSISNHGVDQIFAEHEKNHPYSLACSQYKVFKQAAGKTAKSIVVTLAVRLRHFSLPELVYMTSDDTLHLRDIGKEKTALFIITPVTDTSYNYIVSLLYMQLFQQLYRYGDTQPHNSLPIHVQVLMDEFANVALPPDFMQILATCRKYNISIHPFIQSLAQLKSLYKDDWEVIAGNCDTFVYLGGNDQFTNDYISKMLGKETIDTNTSGFNKGRQGSSSKNFQKSGRELLTQEEVRMIDNDYSLIIIRGEQAAFDQKYRLERHKNYEAAENLKISFSQDKQDKQKSLPANDSVLVYHFVPDTNPVLYSSDEF